MNSSFIGLPPVKLTISGLRKSFTRHLFDGKRLEVLRGVDLVLHPGTFTLLQGASGSGKSSLLRCVYRSCLADAGSIVLRCGSFERDLASADERTMLALRRTHVGLATQFLAVVPRVAAIDLLRENGLDAEAAAELLGALGLPRELFDVPPATFSGGQRQILNVALALSLPRPLLLLDEVTASLDPERRRAVLRVLLERKRAGVTMLAVSHEIPGLPSLVDRIATMRSGVVAA